MERGEITMNNKIISGIVLIGIGIVFLLMNLGYISFSIFFSLFDLWPLILVIVGINIIFKKKPIISFITWTLFFIILIFYGTFYEGRNVLIRGMSTGYGTNITKSIGTSYGVLNLDIGGAKVNIGSEEKDLLKLSAQGDKLEHSETYKNSKETAVLSFRNKNFNGINLNKRGSNYKFDLNKNVIWDLDFDLGAISGELNLEDIPIRSIDLDLGAGNLDIVFGNKHSKSNVYIDAGVSNLTITVPNEVGLKIKMDRALSKINIDDLNLTRLGDYYISSNYEDANTKLEFDIDIGVGKIDFKIK